VAVDVPHAFADDALSQRSRRATVRWLGGFFVVAGLCLAGHEVTAHPASVVAAETHATAAAPGLPRGRRVPHRLVIPALDVAARVVPVALVDRVLVPPDDPGVLGWWRGGADIGATRGSALVTGHTVHTGGGAFDHLGDLVMGDRIVVTTTHGPVAYAVETVTYYPKRTLADAASATFTQAGPPRLVLITCERWNGTSYDGNTVVVAVPAAS
jgi:hypothetical protein